MRNIGDELLTDILEASLGFKARSSFKYALDGSSGYSTTDAFPWRQTITGGLTCRPTPRLEFFCRGSYTWHDTMSFGEDEQLILGEFMSDQFSDYSAPYWEKYYSQTQGLTGIWYDKRKNALITVGATIIW